MAKKRKDGYIQHTFTVNGKRYSVYGKTAKEAKEKELKKRKEIDEQIYLAHEGLTIDSFFERWHDSRRDTVAGATMRREQYMFDAISRAPIDMLDTPFGSLRLLDVDRQHIVYLQNSLKRTRRPTGELYSTRTINDMIMLVRQLFRAAMTERLVRWDPTDGVKSLKRTEEKARDSIHRALTIDETIRFFNACSGNWYEPLYRFLINSGCRIGEAGAIKASDIYDGYVHIEKTITRSEEGLYHIGTTTKTDAGIRVIPCTPAITEAINDQINQNVIVLGKPCGSDGQIFSSSKGNLVSNTKVNESIARICKVAGIEKFTAHAFRDTFATRALEGGMNPKTLQEILGHSDYGMTMNLYAHVMADTKKGEMQLVDTGVGIR